MHEAAFIAGFENGGAGWDGNALQVLTYGDNSFQYADVQAAGNVYDVNLSYGLEIESGGVYELTFTAFSDVDRTIVVGVGLYEDPWTAAIEEVTLSTTPAEFTYSLTADGFGIGNSRAIFDMGGEVGKVYIDNVRLVKTN